MNDRGSLKHRSPVPPLSISHNVKCWYDKENKNQSIDYIHPAYVRFFPCFFLFFPAHTHSLITSYIEREKYICKVPIPSANAKLESYVTCPSAVADYSKSHIRST